MFTFSLFLAATAAIVGMFILAFSRRDEVPTAGINSHGRKTVMRGMEDRVLEAKAASKAHQEGNAAWAQVGSFIELTGSMEPEKASVSLLRRLREAAFLVAAIATGVLLSLEPTITTTMASSTSFIGLVEDNSTLPDWIEIDDQCVYLEGGTFALIIPLDLQRESEYLLLAPADGYKSVDLDDEDSYEILKLPISGQRSRITSLFESIEEREWGEVARLITSLTEFEAAQMETDIWSYTEDVEGTPDVFRQRGRGHELNFVDTLEAMRRFCFAASELEHKLVKLADGSEDAVRREINKALEAQGEVGAEDVTSMAVRQDEGLSRAMQELLRHYKRQGLVLAGGSPDSGLMLFVKPSSLEGVNDAESAQRAAKIFMRGGRAMEGMNFRARLVDFESGDYGHRDGIFMVLSNQIAAEMARQSGIKSGWSFQGQFIDIGRALMKGMVYVVGPDCPADDLQTLLRHAKQGRSGVEAAIDVNIWNKVIDDGSTEGDVVEIDPSDLWVMASDNKSELGQVSISPQLVERAGERLQSWLASRMERSFAEFAQAMIDGDYAEYVPPFGRLGEMAKHGLNFFRSDREDVQDSMDDALAQFARNGAKTQGTPVRLFHDDGLSVDMGDGVPGARVPEAWGLEEGDHFIFVAYPALPALDEEGRNTCIFTCEVEEVSPAPHVYLHGDVALNALRDEDGDEPICIVPEDGEVPVVGQADIGLSTIIDDGDNPKAKIFEAGVSSENVFEVYSRLGAQVGRADNLVTSTMLYLGDQLEHVDTPTDERPTVFMSKAIQASIESMKHVTDEAYSLDALREWTKEVIPHAWDEDGGFEHHPALDVRKPVDEGESTPTDHIRAMARLADTPVENGLWAEHVKGLLKATPTTAKIAEDGGKEYHVDIDVDHLVEESYYEDAAWEIIEAVESLFADKSMVNTVGKMFGEQVWQDACDAGEIGRGDLDAESKEGRLAYHRAQVRHLKVAGMRLRMRLKAAEFAVVQSYFAMKYADGTEGSGRMKAALAVNSPSHLQTMQQVAEGEISGEEEILEALGLDGRNAISSEDKSEEFERTLRDVRTSAGKEVLVKSRDDGQRLEAGDRVTAGVPGQTVRKLTREDGVEFWLQDDSQGELPPAREFRVRETAGYKLTLVSC